MRKSIAVLLIMFFLFPLESLAAETMSIDDYGNYYKKGPYYDADRDAIRYEFNTRDLKESKIEYFHDRDLTQAGTVKVNTVDAGGWYQWTSFYCTGWYRQTFYDNSGNVLISFTMEVAPGDLANPTCMSGPGSDDYGDPDADETCDNCAIFDCPGWDEHLGKLDAIKNAIPPPPNWNQVSQTFSNAIVPRLVNETRVMLSDLLGSAPTPPPAAPDLPPLNDRNFEQEKPTMQDVPGLEGFTENDVKDDAPVLPYEDDPTGGFNLTVDPVNNLPDVVPGGDPGIYKRDPVEPENPMPGAPRETDIDMGDAPVPSDGGSTPPTPGESGGNPPKPGDGVELPGKPDDMEMPGKEYYMTEPKG